MKGRERHQRNTDQRKTHPELPIRFRCLKPGPIILHSHLKKKKKKKKERKKRKKEIYPFETTWMELEGIVLSEISQSEKDNYHMISLLCGI